VSRRGLLTLIPLVVLLIIGGCSGSYPRFTAQNLASPSGEPELEGIASYYGDEFVGRQTSSGEVYSQAGLTAAHRSLPFNTKIKVTNIENGLSVVVRVNDRGPWKSDRILDLSLSAAKQLNMIPAGTARVRIEIVH
jgi:rare lipoprotein A